MGDMGDAFRAMRDHRRELRAKSGVECPRCLVDRPRANATILLPGQKCFCGYVDPRQRNKGEDHGR